LDFRTGSAGTAAGDDEGAGGRGDRLGGPGGDMVIEAGTATGERGRHAAVPRALEHIERDLDVDGPGPGRGEHCEGLGDRLCRAFGRAGALGGHAESVEWAGA